VLVDVVKDDVAAAADDVGRVDDESVGAVELSQGFGGATIVLKYTSGV
jgi:hypothetical protein